ncbi:MAG: ferredoxin-thioredoxin reductase catalytic domain-containing protein [Candidatus Thermoplasmatota archaeon]|nr:ferredoxin-thioredoxin reductase catalytic domain-containing protein [Candidatus Thermoplasmatota archaeon]
MDRKTLEARLEKFAKENELQFSALKDKLIDAILKNKGYCPCRRVKSPSTICPCAYALEEIKQQNKCLCGLFVKVRLK